MVNFALAEYAPFFESTHRDSLCRWPERQRPTSIPTWLRIALFTTGSLTDRVLYRMGRAPGVEFARLDPARSSKWRVDNPDFLEILRESKIVFFSRWMELHHLNLRGFEELRDYCVPKVAHAAAIRHLIAEVRTHCDLLIGVHIRQGNYASFIGKKYFYPSDAYWAMVPVKAALFPGKSVGFLICSNQAQAVPSDFRFPVVFGTGIAVEDVYALAECDRISGPPRTFSLWVLFYGRKPMWEMKSIDAMPREDEFFTFLA